MALANDRPKKDGNGHHVDSAYYCFHVLRLPYRRLYVNKRFGLIRFFVIITRFRHHRAFLSSSRRR